MMPHTYQSLTAIDVAPLEEVNPGRVARGQGRFWRGIKHSDLVGAVKQWLGQSRYRIEQEEFFVSENGAEMLAHLILKRKESGKQLVVGVTNSNSMRAAPSVLLGVCHCSARLSLAEVRMARHGATFDVSREVSYALSRLPWQHMNATVRALQEHLNEVYRDTLLLRLVREEVMSWSKLKGVDPTELHDTWDVLALVDRSNRNRTEMRRSLANLHAYRLVTNGRIG